MLYVDQQRHKPPPLKTNSAFPQPSPICHLQSYITLIDYIKNKRIDFLKLGGGESLKVVFTCQQIKLGIFLSEQRLDIVTRPKKNFNRADRAAQSLSYIKSIYVNNENLTDFSR